MSLSSIMAGRRRRANHAIEPHPKIPNRSNEYKQGYYAGWIAGYRKEKIVRG